MKRGKTLLLLVLGIVLGLAVVQAPLLAHMNEDMASMDGKQGTAGAMPPMGSTMPMGSMMSMRHMMQMMQTMTSVMQSEEFRQMMQDCAKVMHAMAEGTAIEQ